LAARLWRQGRYKPARQQRQRRRQRRALHLRPRHIPWRAMSVALLLLVQLLALTAQLDPTVGQGQGQPEPAPPPFNATVIAAFRAKLLLNPPAVPGSSPYEPPTPPPPPPGWETAVCGVLYEDGERTRYLLENYTDVDAARAAGAHVTHETPCGLCSSLEDLAVYMSIWDMTAPVRACAALGAISRPAGLDCLFELGLTPPCAAIWMDNADYTRGSCLLPCLVHLGSPYNEPEGCWQDPSGGARRGTLSIEFTPSFLSSNTQRQFWFCSCLVLHSSRLSTHECSRGWVARLRAQPMPSVR
jgi:hypothetical protein